MIKQETYVIDIYNPIITAAKPILSLTNSMKQTSSTLSVKEMIYQLSKLIQEFEKQAISMHVEPQDIRDAKYCLCTFVDEIAVRSNWADEEWSKKSLLVTFFDEAWGGESFFTILDSAKKEPDDKIYLLELMYLCLQFDYKGQYQIINDGDIVIDKYKSSLAKIIKRNRPNLIDDLFADKGEQNVKSIEKTWYDIPIWLIISILIVMLACIFMYSNWLLGSHYGAVSSSVNKLTLPSIPAYRITTEIDSTKIEPLLRNKINSKNITVKDYDEKSTITILGDGIFESGSKEVKSEYYSIIAVIGQELDNVSGRIVVSGHTDDRPINSIEYPSNWHLSQARADKVKQILIDRNNRYIKDQSRVRSEGFGESQPAFPNDSKENRAKNRRVEITIFHDGKYY